MQGDQSVSSFLLTYSRLPRTHQRSAIEPELPTPTECDAIRKRGCGCIVVWAWIWRQLSKRSKVYESFDMYRVPHMVALGWIHSIALCMHEWSIHYFYLSSQAWSQPQHQDECECRPYLRSFRTFCRGSLWWPELFPVERRLVSDSCNKISKTCNVGSFGKWEVISMKEVSLFRWLPCERMTFTGLWVLRIRWKTSRRTPNIATLAYGEVQVFLWL